MVVKESEIRIIRHSPSVIILSGLDLLKTWKLLIFLILHCFSCESLCYPPKKEPLVASLKDPSQ